MPSAQYASPKKPQRHTTWHHIFAKCRLIGDQRIGKSTAWQNRAGADCPSWVKRLEIARALAAEPRVLLLDEPAAGCNPVETEEIDRLIAAIAARGTTVVLVEHDMKLVMRISNRILVLNHGRMLALGSPAEVRGNPEVIAAYLGRHGAEAAHASG
jgi:branched-chain amino acid transport system ATP-binding protein